MCFLLKTPGCGLNGRRPRSRRSRHSVTRVKTATSMLRRSTNALARATAHATYGARRTVVTAKLPDLEYDFGALEPVINAEIMELHHQKHHNTYVTNFNAAQEKYAEAEAKGDYSTMIAMQPAIKFNGGGHVNHSMFWKCLTAPKDFAMPEGELLKMIERDFGSLDAMQDKFTTATVAVQGSGWGWLGYNKATGKLAVTTTANQDPCVTTGLTPLLGVDVWEHAYYLQYKNLRPDYVKNIWKIINWKVRVVLLLSIDSPQLSFSSAL
jgi:Fe-Mn family superoxide dismutase